MDVIEKFLNEVSWKFDKGYPDITNEQDILLLERLLNENGVEIFLNEGTKAANTRKAIDIIVNSSHGKEHGLTKMANAYRLGNKNKIDKDKFKAQYDKHYDDYGDDEEFIEEFGGDFLSPNIDAINQYYGAKVYADDVIDDFFMAGGKNNISSNEKFEAWLDKNREFYL